MMELTTLDGYPVFVAMDSIELIEQQEDGTCICTKGDKMVFVAENASDIYFEWKKYKEEQEMIKFTALQMGMQQ